MGSGVRTRYNVALNGRGFMLKGSPQNPAYSKSEVGLNLGNIAADDPTYNPMNGSDWNYWAQTDWSGGFQAEKFRDDASFKDGQAIDPLTKYGEVRLQEQLGSSGTPISGSFTTVGGALGFNSKIVVGLSKSGVSRLYNTFAGTNSLISAMAGVTSVNDVARYKEYVLIGMTRTSGTTMTLKKYDGTTLSNVASASIAVRAIRSIGIRAYIAQRDTALSGDILAYTTDLSTFTSGYQAGTGTTINKIEELNGSPYFFVQDGSTVRMYRYDEYQETAFPVHTFEGLTNWGVCRFLSFIIISGKIDSIPAIFAFNGNRLVQIFSDKLDKASSYDFSRPLVFQGNLHVGGVMWDGKYFFPGMYATKTGYGDVVPLASTSGRMYAYATSGTVKTQFFVTNTGYYMASGYVVGSNFGHRIGHVDKLVNSVQLNFAPLASGHTIQIYRSTDDGSTYTSIGSASFGVDGAISGKTLYFPSGFVTKKWLYKAQLATTVTETTPRLFDVVHQYRPIPNTKARWRLALQADDGVRLLNGQKEQRSASEIAAELWYEKQKKQTMTFEDICSFSAKLAASMTASDTSAFVVDTDGMPRRGRMRIVSGGVAEEMVYTSADGKRILGISRGQKGTLARAYTTAQTIDNNHTVVITDVDQRIIDTDETKTESIIGVTLLEV